MKFKVHEEQDGQLTLVLSQADFTELEKLLQEKGLPQFYGKTVPLPANSPKDAKPKKKDYSDHKLKDIALWSSKGTAYRFNLRVG